MRPWYLATNLLALSVVVRMRVQIDPPAIVQPSRMQEDISATKEVLAKVAALGKQTDEMKLEAGRRLLQLRDTVPIGWGEFCSKELGISKSWAATLMQMAKGKTTPEKVRAETKERVAEHRAKDVGPEKVKKEEIARTTKIRAIIKEWKAASKEADHLAYDLDLAKEALRKIEELVK